MFPVVPVWQVYLWHRRIGETLRQHLQLKSFINLRLGTVSEILMLRAFFAHVKCTVRYLMKSNKKLQKTKYPRIYHITQQTRVST